jgi:hypothetical protein
MPLGLGPLRRAPACVYRGGDVTYIVDRASVVQYHRLVLECCSAVAAAY